jgi:hypothetical protein
VCGLQVRPRQCKVFFQPSTHHSRRRVIGGSLIAVSKQTKNKKIFGALKMPYVLFDFSVQNLAIINGALPNFVAFRSEHRLSIDYLSKKKKT